MVGVDKAHVARVVEEASKGSKYYANAQAREGALAARVAALREAVDRTSAAELARGAEALRAYAARLEAHRNLTRVCVVLDMDQFFAAVEARDDPSLAGKPFAVGGMGMISTASYEARRYGVRSAMPGFIAVKLCPALLFVPPHFDKYEAAAAVTRRVFADYDADFRSGSLDEAFLDLTAYCERTGVLPPQLEGGGRQLPSAAEVAAIEEVVAGLRGRIRADTGGLTASAGIAPNALLAKICSNDNKPNGQAVVAWSRDAIVSYLAPLPVRRLPGVGKVMESTLAGLGIHTCADVTAHLGRVAAAFNERTAQWLVRMVAGVADGEVYGWGTALGEEDVAAGITRKSLSHERTFGDCAAAPELRAKCRSLCESVAADLAGEGLLARTITLKLKLHTFEVRQKGVSLPRATADVAVIAATADALLVAEFPLTLRLMGVRASGLSKAGAKPTLLDRFVAAGAGGSGSGSASGGDSDGDSSSEDDDDDVEVLPTPSLSAAVAAAVGAPRRRAAAAVSSAKRRRRMQDYFGASAGLPGASSAAPSGGVIMVDDDDDDDAVDDDDESAFHALVQGSPTATAGATQARRRPPRHCRPRCVAHLSPPPASKRMWTPALPPLRPLPLRRPALPLDTLRCQAPRL